MLSFEWDDRKPQRTLPNTASVSLRPLPSSTIPFSLDLEDRSMDYGEVRRRIIRLGTDLILTVAYTERDDRIRLISDRKATKAEARAYVEARW